MIATDDSFSAGTSIEVLNANHHFENVYIFVWQMCYTKLFIMCMFSFSLYVLPVVSRHKFHFQL